MPCSTTGRVLQAAIFVQSALLASASDVQTTPQVELCDLDLKVYSTASKCLKGFSSDYTQSYSIIADGKCHDSMSDDLGYYIATCDVDFFQLARSKCTDETCTDCADVKDFSGKFQEGGCLVDWSVSDLDKPGSVPFSAIADGECRDSGIEGLGYYKADCDEDGNWFELTQSSCSNDICSDCTGDTQNNNISPLRSRPLAFTYEGKRECNVNAFYKEQVWSVSGSCQREGCSSSIASTFPVKWWLTNPDEGSTQCIYGSDYPEQYHTNNTLGEALLFDSRAECCEANTGNVSCQPTSSPNASFIIDAPTPIPEDEEVGSENSASLISCSYLLAFVFVCCLF